MVGNARIDQELADRVFAAGGGSRWLIKKAVEAELQGLLDRGMVFLTWIC